LHFEIVKGIDIALQKELLLVALWTPDDEPVHKPEVLELPHIKEYYEDWGKRGDLGFFAISSTNQPMGIIQLRYKSSQTKKYADYPEIAIAVHLQYRGQGVASALVRKLLDSTDCGLRLGVHPMNTSAIALYEKFGFEVYEIAKSGFPQMVLVR